METEPNEEDDKGIMTEEEEAFKRRGKIEGKGRAEEKGEEEGTSPEISRAIKATPPPEEYEFELVGAGEFIGWMCSRATAAIPRFLSS